MNILIAGGAGFIGSHLAEKLLESGHQIFCIDNFLSGRPQNIEHLQKNKQFHFFEHDVTAPFSQDLPALDIIFHLAFPSSLADAKEIPLHTLWIHAEGTKRLAELAYKNSASLILVSSADVYGVPSHSASLKPLKESDLFGIDPLSPQASLVEGKRFAETLAYTYHKHYGFPLQIARVFETFGKRMRKRDGRIFTEFMDAALTGEPLYVPQILSNSGTNAASIALCFIDDVIEGLVQLMNAPTFLGPVNLGNPELTSLQELATKIVEHSKSDSMIVPDPIDPANPNSRNNWLTPIPDISLAQEKLGFKPKVSVLEGLKRLF